LSHTRAFIFDIDGTLVDSNELHVDSWDRAFRKFGKQFPREALRAQIGKGSDQYLPEFLTNKEIADFGKNLMNIAPSYSGSADSIICCVEPTSIKRIRARIENKRNKEKPPGHVLVPWRLRESNFLSSTFFGAPGGRALPNRNLSHPEGIERRLIDRCCRGEPLVALVGGERLAGQRPE
jgi:hypothetical protein